MDPNKIGSDPNDTGPNSRYGPHPVAGREGTVQWNDGTCNTEAPFVCGFCTPPGAAARPRRYVYMADEQPFATAQYNCLQLGGNLASIHSRANQEAVLAVLPRDSTVWIGFHDRDGEAGCQGSLFFWSDGTVRVKAIFQGIRTHASHHSFL